MIALIHGVPYELAPLVVTGNEFKVEIDADLQAHAYIGEKRIEYGVIWYSFGKSADIDPKSGKITVNHAGKTIIRAVFGDFHQDYEINIE